MEEMKKDMTELSDDALDDVAGGQILTTKLIKSDANSVSNNKGGSFGGTIDKFTDAVKKLSDSSGPSNTRNV